MEIFQVFNQFSFVILSLLFFLIAVAVLVWRRAKWPLWAGLGVLLVVFLLFAMTTGQSSAVRWDTPENIRQSLSTAEEPILIEFYSNY